MPAKKKVASPRKKKVVCSCAPDVDKIRERAYLIWEEKGRPGNSDVEHWLEAEQQFMV